MTDVLRRLDEMQGYAVKAYAKARRHFSAMGLKNCRDVLRNYSNFDADIRFASLAVFWMSRCIGTAPLLFSELSSRSARVGGMASIALGSIADDVVISRLEAIVSGATSRILYLNAVSAITKTAEPSLHDRAASILTRIIDNSAACSESRATAAEGLVGLLAQTDRRRFVFRNAVKSLIRAAHDRSPNVRCCAAYALGQLEAKAAIPVLLHIAEHDRGWCRGIGSVRTEAGEAIARIRNSRRGCASCPSQKLHRAKIPGRTATRN